MISDKKHTNYLTSTFSLVGVRAKPRGALSPWSALIYIICHLVNQVKFINFCKTLNFFLSLLAPYGSGSQCITLLYFSFLCT